MGLTLGIAVFILIMAYVYFEFNFERHLYKPEQLYRVYKEHPGGAYKKSTAYATTQYPLGPYLRDQFPEVTEFSRIGLYELLLRNDRLSSIERVHGVDPSGVDLFAIDLIKGQGISDEAPNQLLLSNSMAERFFGNREPIGQTMVLGDSLQYEVAGIFADPPANTHLQMHAVIPLNWMARQRTRNLHSWRNSSFFTYIRLRPGARLRSLEDKVARAMLDVLPNPLDEEGNPRTIFKFQPVSKIHLEPGINFDWQVASNPLTVRIFGIIAFFILGLACINYINLSVARSARRAMEIGVRKVVGAQKKQLVFQYLGETIFLAYFSFLLALIMAHFLFPFVNRLLGYPIDLSSFYQPHWVGLAIVFPLLLGAVAGMYPALVLSSFRPLHVLKGRLSGISGKDYFQNGLILFQFLITIILIIATLVVHKQMHFIQNKELGYSKARILNVSLRDPVLRENMDLIRNALSKHPQIQNLTFSWRYPNDISSQTAVRWEGGGDNILPIYFNFVDTSFTDVYDLEVIQGKGFSRLNDHPDQTYYLVNEEAVRQMGWENAIGKILYRGTPSQRINEGRVVGVIKNFHQHDLRQPYQPVYFVLGDANSLRYMSVKLSGREIPETLGFIEQTLGEFSSGYPFEYAFFDDIFDQAYRKDARLLSLFKWFSILAILIACMGLVAMVAYTTGRKQKEIGIRKVIGATARDIIFLLSRKFFRPLWIAFIIGIPSAYWIMRLWLRDFAFHITLNPVIFFLAIIMVISLVMLLIILQTWRTATANPVNMIRRE